MRPIVSWALPVLLLAVMGRALGFALSVGLLEGLGVLAAARIPRMAEVGVDSGVLLFLVLVTGAVALLFGVSRAGPFIPSS